MHINVCRVGDVQLPQLMPIRTTLVEVFATTPCITKTRHFDFLDWKLVVIGQFFTTTYVPQSKDDNVNTSINNDLSRVAVWLARMINEACNITTLCCIDDLIVTTTKHVATDAMSIVSSLSDVSHRSTDHLTNILHYHLTMTDVMKTKQSKAVNS